MVHNRFGLRDLEMTAHSWWCRNTRNSYFLYIYPTYLLFCII